jgi:AraC family transcriptional regulator, regulatory protein of adaptative response / methylated-DNA-[protein]-cysteine methyltransferase
MTDYERVESVIRHLKQHYVRQPDLRTLAGIAQVSEFHFHRLFSRWAGITPKALVKFLTAKHAKALLREPRACSTRRSTRVYPGPVACTIFWFQSMR